jgi:predicted secreted protein
MRSFIFKLFVIIVLMGLFRLAFAQKDYSHEFKVIRVPHDKIITIDLDANPTTGFSWRLASISDKNVLEFVKKEFFPDEGGLIGSGGVEKWSFKTLESGKTSVILEYVREWEKDIPAAKRKEFNIFVK